MKLRNLFGWLVVWRWNLINSHPASFVTNWILDCVITLPHDQIAIFFMHLWVIWKERNNVVWNDASLNPGFISARAMVQPSEYQNLHPSAKTINLKKSRTTYLFEQNNYVLLAFLQDFRVLKNVGTPGRYCRIIN